MTQRELDGYLNEDEASEVSRFAVDTLRDWRRYQGYGPPSRKIGNKVFYPEAGFMEAVLHRGRKPKQAAGRKVDKRLREAGRHMQISGQMHLWAKRQIAEARATIPDIGTINGPLEDAMILIVDRAIENFYGPADA